MIIVIDDLRVFQEHLPEAADVLYLRTSREALNALLQLWMEQEYNKDRIVDQLWLDHDLGQTDTTIPVVDQLTMFAAQERPLMVEEIVIHSSNAGATSSMKRTLERYNYKVRQVPAHLYFTVEEDATTCP